VAGALADHDYLDKLARAGFADAAIEVTRVYGVDDAREFLAAQRAELQQLAAQVDGKFASGFIRATKPLTPATSTRSATLAPAARLPAAAEAASAATNTDAAPASCCAPSCCGSAAR
jgi:hypothetical protein